MGEAFRGSSGSGSVTVYSVPRGYTLRLELLTFVMTCDGTAGIHKARLTFFDTSLAQTTAVLRDLNEGGPSQVLRYTYGIGLVGSACVAVNGWDITDALPDTTLAPLTTLTLQAVNDSGTQINGDAFSSVALFGELTDTTADAAPPVSTVALLPGLLPG